MREAKAMTRAVSYTTIEDAEGALLNSGFFEWFTEEGLKWAAWYMWKNDETPDAAMMEAALSAPEYLKD